MNAFWAALIPIVFIATVVYVVYKARRASQERRQRSDERAAALLANLRAHAPLPDPTVDAKVMAAAVQAPRPAAPQPVPARGLKRRARILTDAQRMLFLILRAAMPEHVIMAHVRLLDLLEAPEAAAIAGSDPGSDPIHDGSTSLGVEPAVQHDARLRALGCERLDFVVCDSDLIPIAAIVLYAAGIRQVPDESTKIEALRELGVRFLRFRADSLPRPAEARHLVLS